MNQEELAALKRQRVSRSLPFTTDICGRSGGDVDDGADHMSVDEEVDSDTQNMKSLQDLRVSDKQVIHLRQDFFVLFLKLTFVRISLNCTHYFQVSNVESPPG